MSFIDTILASFGYVKAEEPTVPVIEAEFVPWYDKRIFEEIRTKSEDDAVKAIHKLKPRELIPFADEHSFNFKMGKYRNNVHESDVIAKSVTYCVHEYEKRGCYYNGPTIWDFATDWMAGLKAAKMADDISEINKKLG